MGGRRCTDAIWIFAFAAAWAGLTKVLEYARTNGDYRRLYHGYSYLGTLCGVDVPEQFLYYCPDASGQPDKVDLQKPVCVKECPTAERSRVWECGGAFGYASRPVAERYCIPNEAAVQVAEGSSPMKAAHIHAFAERLAQLRDAWPLLAGAACMAFVLGYVYLLTLGMCAGLFVWLCLLLVVLAPLGTGAYLIWVARFDGGFDGVPHMGNDDHNTAVGVATGGLGVVLLLVVCCSASSIDLAIKAVRSAADCIRQSPSLLLSPLLELSLKVTSLSAMFSGFLLLVSCGTIRQGAGLYREFEYTRNEKLLIVYYVVMLSWVCELMTSVSQFVVSYAAQLWFFVPYKNKVKVGVPAFGLLRGYTVALTFHAGSLILGSFIIAFFRILRIVFCWVSKAMKDRNNEVGAVIANVCVYGVECFTQLLEFANKNAYVEVAMSSAPLCKAARKAVSVVSSEFVAVGILNGATWIIQLAGVGLITSIGAFLTWTLCSHVSPFNDSTSKHFVADKVSLTVASAVVCFVVAFAFAVVFDTVSDTIIYCYAVEQEEKEERVKLLAADGDGEGEAGGAQDAGANSRRARGERSACAPPLLQQLVDERCGAAE